LKNSIVLNNKTLHIISFDIPYPANYGGVIDVFYKIKSLKDEGFNIILHCFYKDRKPADILANLCREVHYYKREMNPYLTLVGKPFIVSSRKQPALFEIITKDSHPVLFEGIHTTYFIRDFKKAGKKCFVRTHNIEHRYYTELAKAEKSLIRRGFFKLESRKLEKYESALKLADGLITISEQDDEYFSDLHSNTVFISPFHPEPEFDTRSKNEKYVFYHGNLEVSENLKAAKFLINEVMPGLGFQLVIAGKAASKLDSITKGKSVVLVDSPKDEEMLKWASGATVHLLPTFQATGFKLKLIYSLYTAKVIIANSQMVDGTGLEHYAQVANSVSEWRQEITETMNSSENLPIIERNKALKDQVSNKSLSDKLIKFLR